MGFLERNIAAMLMILFTLLLRRFLLHKVPYQVFGVLWGLVIIRLYIPYSYVTDINIYNAIYGIRSVIAEKNPLQVSSQQYYPDRRFIEFIEIPEIKYVLLTIWLLGAVMLAVYFYREYQKVRRLWETAIVSEDARVAREMLEKKHKLVDIEIRTSDSITVPMACGIRKKGILLPAGFTAFSEEEQSQMLLHEYMHLKYRHTLLQLLIIGILCLNWFNPILWLWYRYMSRDMEIACDAHVLDVLGREQRESYARNLLQMAEQQSHKDVFCAGFTRHSIGERIVAIMQYKRVTAIALMVSMLIPAGVAFAFGTSDNYIFGDEFDSGKITVTVEVPESAERVYVLRYEDLKPYIVREVDNIFEIERFAYEITEGSLPMELKIFDETNNCLYGNTLILEDRNIGDGVGYYSGILKNNTTKVR